MRKILVIVLVVSVIALLGLLVTRGWSQEISQEVEGGLPSAASTLDATVVTTTERIQGAGSVGSFPRPNATTSLADGKHFGEAVIDADTRTVYLDEKTMLMGDRAKEYAKTRYGCGTANPDPSRCEDGEAFIPNDYLIIDDQLGIWHQLSVAPDAKITVTYERTAADGGGIAEGGAGTLASLAGHQHTDTRGQKYILVTVQITEGRITRMDEVYTP